MKTRYILVLLFIPFFLVSKTRAQSFLLSGGVYDTTQLVPVPMVKVQSTKGQIAYTDSAGRFRILVTESDSVFFFYRNKYTTRYAVKDIKNPDNFEISLQIRVYSKYKTLQEVVVFGKSYREDSVENRNKYRSAFEFQKPGVRLSNGDPYSGLNGVGAGLDPNELINVFRFRRTHAMKSLQKRLLEEEQQKFVDYRFNKQVVRQLTGLQGSELERFMKLYRPPYELAAATTDYQFYQYILDASKLYKTGVLPSEN